MRMLDEERKQSVHTLQLYLTPGEAKQLSRALARLLDQPEAREHEHVVEKGGVRDLSVSILTPAKLADLSRYTEVERMVLEER